MWALGCQPGKAEESTGRKEEQQRRNSLYSCPYWHVKQGQGLGSNPGPQPLISVGLDPSQDSAGAECGPCHVPRLFSISSLDEISLFLMGKKA